MTDVERVMALVAAEIATATQKHRPLHSIHEAYAVIREELDEFWDEAKKKDRDPSNMHDELVQVAAMAIRACVDLL